MLVLIEGYFWMLWLAGIIFSFEHIEKQPGYDNTSKVVARILSLTFAFLFPIIYIGVGVYALAAITTFIQERNRVK